MHRVLISHTREMRDHPADGGFVAAVERAVLRAGMTVSDMAYFAARDDAPPEVCAEQVRAADIVVGVLGLRYGSLAGRDVSYTELEFDTATELGRPRLMFLLDEHTPAPLPPTAMIDREHGARQDAFRAKVRAAGLVAATFSTPDELEKLVFQALVDHGRHRKAPRYLAQVRDILPRDGVLDREAELAELASWCAGDEPYVWWQAPPWSGKSALTAAFVLDPPPGVQVVAFFVTARLAGQSDATAFTDAVLEQLTAILGEELPGNLSPSALDSYRRDLLARAAGRPGRLVLVVDGLDEDTGGPGLPSIASLLPKHLPAGLRVIVAGRPNPGLPGDVPADHPLRTCRVRELAASPHAAELERRARWELDRLLARDDRHRDLIGLITAAGGGLTGAELQELTGLGAFDVEGMLDGECGRTVAARLDTSLLTARRVHLFAHDTLRATAVGRLGVLLDRYRVRLHDWIGTYRDRGWPAGTPPYALSGYFPMLVETGDTDRVRELAVDPERHHRLLAVTGGDAGALAEIRAAERMCPADLPALARLNVHATAIAERNAQIPGTLPVVWARLGHTVRAEALARAVDDPASRADVLAAVAAEVLARGDQDRAWAMVTEAEASARATVPQSRRDAALRGLAQTVARMGDPGRARAIAGDIATPALRLEALIDLIPAMDDPGFARTVKAEAERLAGTARDGDLPDLLHHLARAALLAGELQDAESVASGPADVRLRALLFGSLATDLERDSRRDEAEALARGIAEAPVRAAVLMRLAEAANQEGEEQYAARLAGEVQRIGDFGSDPLLRAQTAIAVLSILGSAAPLLRSAAEAAVDEIVDADQRAVTRDELIAALFRTGDRDGAAAIAAGVVDPGERASALAELPALLAGSGELDRAEETVRGLDGNWRDYALDSVARVAVGLGEYDRAVALVGDTTAGIRPNYLRNMVALLAAAGQHDRARTVAETIAVPALLADALTEIADALATTGDPAAVSLAARAEATARAAVDPSERDRAIGLLAAAVERCGDHRRADELATLVNDRAELGALLDALISNGRLDRAESIARDIDDHVESDRVRNRPASRGIGLREVEPVAWRLARDRTPEDAERIVAGVAAAIPRACAWLRLAASAWEAGRHEQVARAADAAGAAGESIDDATDRALAAVAVAASAELAGMLGRADEVARGIADPRHRDQALRAVAEVAARRGDLDRAEMLARSVADTDERDQALVLLAVSVAESGDHDRAEALVRDITGLYLRARGMVRVGIAARADRRRVERLVEAATAAAAELSASGIWGASNLTDLLAQADEDAFAEAMARVAEPAERDYALALLALRLAERGDHERSWALLAELGNDDDNDRVLREFAAWHAARGELDRAEEIAGRMNFPETRASTLLRLAARVGRREHVERLIAQALTLAPWTSTIVAIADLAPEVVTAVDHQLARDLGAEVTAR